MRDTAKAFGEGPAASIYAGFADLVSIGTCIAEWHAAVVAATSDADRFLRAAKEKASIWLKEYAGREHLLALGEIAANVSSVSTSDDGKAVLSKLAKQPLPLGIFASHPKERPIFDGDHRSVGKEKPKLAVAFVEFTIDGRPVADIQHMAPNVTHDLELHIRISRWPEKAERLVLTPLSVESATLYQLPTFKVSAPSGDPPFTFSVRERAVFSVPQSFFSRPLEFKYGAEFQPLSVEQPVEVVGQRTLRLESVDWQRNPQTGYANIDQRILRIRDELRRWPTVSQDERAICLKLLVNLAKHVGQAVQDNVFPGVWSEGQFQIEVRKALRNDPSIGSALQEHPRSAGGIGDLMFQGVPIELKVETNRTLALEDCKKFIKQTTSYAVGNGKRIGILCVLDTSPKVNPPFPMEEGIGILFREADGYVLPVVTILIQGNLTPPSHFSR
ncbi:hypothetical protein [Hyphomicrobium sp. DY-1]|uniref:hypothetical protein n=1 Tax=Hyphomicrobium sp. DY-1 TaxID=3075650 RepID=UPI0039C35A82